MGEFVGYRANAKKLGANRLNEGFVTVYAERKNEMAALGEYGGDAYPVVSAIPDDRCEFGIILAADGVGQGAYTHPSLKKNLDKNYNNFGVNESDKNYAKLSCFLRTLYGGKIFEEPNTDALEYAMRCFADVPTDGFFISPDEGSWKDAANAQAVMPFFERDSQSLGSRILCVYIYLNYRNYMADNRITEWTEEEAKKLRDDINNNIENDLAEKVLGLFEHSDIDNTTKKMRYFLCSTVAVWFYYYDKTTGKISALSLNCGDARTYVANTTDGVRQISVDDAVADGSMTGFFHFGTSPKKDEGFSDNTLRARIIEAQAPCILFACSDGVYDTCPGKMASDGKKFSLPYGDSDEANDFMFAKNMLEALRRSYSFEDFRREVVFNFYAQDGAGGVLETRAVNSYAHVKRDDSATLAARFFGEKPLEILDALRNTNETRIDKLWNKLEESAKGRYPIPYYLPHVQSSDDAVVEAKTDYARGAFKDAIQGVLKANYHDLFVSMQESGSSVIWGVPHPGTAELAGFSLNRQFISPFANYDGFFATAMADWKALLENGGILISGNNGDKLSFKGVPEEWEVHEHVICSEEIFDILMGVEFDKKYKTFTTGSKADKSGDIMLALYDWFEERFTGCVNKERGEVWTASDDGRADVDDGAEEIIRSLSGESAAVETVKAAAEEPAEAVAEEPAEEQAETVEESPAAVNTLVAPAAEEEATATEEIAKTSEAESAENGENSEPAATEANEADDGNAETVESADGFSTVADADDGETSESDKPDGGDE